MRHLLPSCTALFAGAALAMAAETAPKALVTEATWTPNGQRFELRYTHAGAQTLIESINSKRPDARIVVDAIKGERTTIYPHNRSWRTDPLAKPAQATPGATLPPMPGMPSMPAMPATGATPGATIPGMPAMPAMPNIPAMPGSGSMPGTPSTIPAILPGASIPDMPPMPAMPSMPAIPGPSATGTPGAMLPSIPDIPAMPPMAGPSTGMPAMPSMPAMPGMPGPGAAAGMPAMPMMPGMQEPITLQKTDETRTLLDRKATKYTITFRQHTTVEIWAVPDDEFGPFLAYAQQPPRRRMIMPDPMEQWDALLRQEKLSPLLAIFSEFGHERARFEVTRITPVAPKDLKADFTTPSDYFQHPPEPF